jgi:hypothetical protein
MNENTEMIVSSTGEETELSAPADFGNGLAFLNPEEMPDLESADVGINIQPEYVEFINVGDKIRAVYNGITHITTKDKQNPGEYKKIEAVVMQTKDGVKLNAGASLVNQFRNLRPGTAVQVTYSGKEKTKSGNEVKTYDVRLLNVPRVNVPESHPAPAVVVNKPQYKNMEKKDAYWKMVSEVRLTNQEGNDHLAEFNYDFSAALDALTPEYLK